MPLKDCALKVFPAAVLSESLRALMVPLFSCDEERVCVPIDGIAGGFECLSANLLGDCCDQSLCGRDSRSSIRVKAFVTEGFLYTISRRLKEVNRAV